MSANDLSLITIVIEFVDNSFMTYHAPTAILLWFALAAWQAPAQDNEQPRLSATDTEYLSCSFWTGKEWSPATARSARTQIFKSPKGYRAYAEVKASTTNESCENSATLYVALGNKAPFKIAYAQPRPGGVDGNGIRIIGWSPNNDKLLVELNFWKYDTDRGFWQVPLIYDAWNQRASEIDGLDKALTRHFGSDCEFEPTVEGWKDNARILVKVSRTLEDNSYEQHFCVREPRLFVYDIQNQSVQAVDK